MLSEPILLVGKGVEGNSFLRYMGSRADISIYDQNIQEYEKVPKWDSFMTIVKSPGVPWSVVPKWFHDRVTSPTQIFFDALNKRGKGKIVAITGTKGKSTSTAFLSHVLRVSGIVAEVAGNIGKPVLDFVEAIGDLDFLVTELSSFQLENLSVSIDYVICTNLYEDHLDRYASVSAYHNAKKNLWKSLNKRGFLYAPEHQAALFASDQIKICPPISDDYFAADSIFNALHWRQNFGMIYVLCKDLGISDETFRAAARSFAGLEHRLQHIKTWNGVRFYNDSISTNPHSAIAAARLFSIDLRLLLLGGQDRGMDYEAFLDELKQACPAVSLVLYDSDLQQKLADLARKKRLDFTLSETMLDAVVQAKEISNGVVLLSPAAPSFDRYKNYIERGNTFIQAVQALSNSAL